MRSNKVRPGFSLVEVLVLLLITSIVLSTAGLGSSILIKRATEQKARGELNVMADQMKADIIKHGYLSPSELKDELKCESYFERMGGEFAVKLLDLSTMYYVDHEIGSPLNAFYFGTDYDGVKIDTEKTDPWKMPYRVYYLASTIDDSFCIILASSGSDCEFSEVSASGYVGYNDSIDIGDDILVFLNKPDFW